MKKCLAFIAAACLISGSYADVILQDWQFNDASGTVLDVVTNTGTIGTSWNFGGPRTQNGNLNIGDTAFWKWSPNSQPTTTRTASFDPLTSGQYVFKFVVADWNLAGTDGLGVVGNGIKFKFGSTNGSAQLEFEVAQAPSNDIRGREQN